MVSIYLVSACTTGEEFVAAFRRYADRGSLFVPIAEPIPAGRRGRFALTLAGGGVLVEGEAEVISSSKAASVLHGRVGMTLRFGDLDDRSKTVLVELEKARLAAKPPAPSVAPRLVELPAGPRPKPPATSVRIDASVALAECTALGDLEALEKTVAAPPKAGPKFVVPSVPPVGAPRAQTPTGAQPIVERSRMPSGPQPVVRPKTPSVPPPMPPLPRSPTAPAPKLALDVALANASLAIEAAKSEAADGPRTEAMDIPPAPFTPTEMEAIDGPRTETIDVPPAPAEAEAPKPPDWRLMTMRAAAPPPPITPAPPIVAAPQLKALEPDLDEPTDLTMIPIIPEDSGRKTSLGVAAIQRAPARPATPFELDPDDAPVEIVDALPPELDSRPMPIDDADTSVTEQPAEAPMPAAVRAGKLPTVEEPTPSGDWTITPGAGAPTIAPRKPSGDELVAVAQAAHEVPAPAGPPARLTGNWTIQLDSTSPDGWSEPSKVDAAALRDPVPDPVPDPDKPKKKRTKPTPETPPELRPVARSIMMDPLPAAPPEHATTSEEPKVQIDPTLMEAPIVDPRHGAPVPATPSALRPAIQVPPPVPVSVSAPPSPPSPPSPPPDLRPQEVPVIPVALQRLATPVPGSMAPLRPIDRPTPSPIGIDPRVTPLPASLSAKFPAPTPVQGVQGVMSPAELVSLPTPPPGRLVTDGGVGFFRDSGEIVNTAGSGSFPVGDSTSLVVARRRRRYVVIAISAALAVALGVVLVIVLAGGSDKKPDEPQVAADAAVVQPKQPKQPPDPPPKLVTPDAAVAVEPPKDAAPIAPPVPVCTVEVTTVPPGAEVLVQGSLDVLGQTPVKLPLPCGLEVRLLVRKQRFGNVIRTLTPTEEGVAIRMTLAKLMFSVKLSSAPAGATISINGKAVAVTPTTMKLPAFEPTTVTFAKEGFAVDTQKVTPKLNAQTVHAVLKKKTRR